jgi:hypothetical protein
LLILGARELLLGQMARSVAPMDSPPIRSASEYLPERSDVS